MFILNINYDLNKRVQKENGYGPRSLVNYLSCQICFEHFDVDRNLVPRPLPYFHTLCEKCIKEMIKETT